MKAEFEELLAGDLPYLLKGADELPECVLIYPGSFNPFHAGHHGLLQAASEVSDRTGLLEISVVNADKPPLNLETLQRRIRTLPAGQPFLLTRAATFLEKAEIFPGAWFAMGFDTAVRLLDQAYHGDVPAMFDRFVEMETRFVVAGRLYGGSYQCLEHLEIPARFEGLFIPVSESRFRKDVSSTGLRGE